MTNRFKVEIGTLVYGGNHEPGLVIDKRNIDERNTGLGKEILILYPNNRKAWETEGWHGVNRAHQLAKQRGEQKQWVVNANR